ncbi:MAG: hemerythrin domain-containing protein, partial [Burkholderiales bacterium]
MKDALKMFRDEHRSLAAVLRAMHDLVERVHGGGLPDFDGLRAMLYYVDAYSARLHHPKEDELLFQPLRARGGDADALVEELEREHVRLAAA